jgi:ligand-binding sensor domain-containing protein
MMPVRRWWFAILLFFLIVGTTGVVGMLVWSIGEKQAGQQKLLGWQAIRPPHEVSALAADGEIIWAGGRDGVWRLEITGEEAPEALNCEAELAYVRALLVETPGSLWIGHAGGLTFFDGNSCRTYNTRSGLPSDRLFAIYLDRDDRLWIGSEGGAARKIGDKWQKAGEEEGLLANSVNVIMQDHLGGMWFGSYIAPKGGLSICMNRTCQYFTTKNGLPHNNITSIMQDADGFVWVGTGFSDYGGAARFGLTDEGWKIIEVLSSKKGLAGEKVRSIYQDRLGVMWFGSEYDGLARWDGVHWDVFTEKNGLSNNEVKAMLQDQQGNFWIGTRDGVTRISLIGLDRLNREK